MKTVKEAVRALQGHGAGMVNGLSVKYAQTLLQPEEEVLAAVIANISTPSEHFPGVAVLTDRRIFAACGLPGIRRSIVCEMDKLDQCEEKPNAVSDKFLFSQGKTSFSMTLDPENGEKFARALAAYQGLEDEFDAVQVKDSPLLNPTLMRNKTRARLAQEKAAARKEEARTAAQAAAAGAAPAPENRQEEAPEETAQRLSRQLEEARREKSVDETDPLAVAARLAQELAEQEKDD